jgi:hypothetical protein
MGDKGTWWRVINGRSWRSCVFCSQGAGKPDGWRRTRTPAQSSASGRFTATARAVAPVVGEAGGVYVASISFCGVRRYRLRWMAGRDGWRDGQMLSSRWPPLILPNIPIKVDGFGTSVSASHGTQKACRCRHHDGMDFTVPGQPAS